MSRSSLKGFSAFAVLTFFAAGCERCGEPPVVAVNQCVGVPGSQADRPNACSDNTDCGEHFGCKPVKDNEAVQCCVFVDRACTTEADCCPGQTCPADRKKCFDKFIGCQQDSECGDRGDRVCEVYTDTYGTSNRCRFRPCGALGECGKHGARNAVVGEEIAGGSSKPRGTLRWGPSMSIRWAPTSATRISPSSA